MKKSKKTLWKFSLLLFFISYLQPMASQVVIGNPANSANPPVDVINKSALLDLRMWINSDGTTADKALILPKVSLEGIQKAEIGSTPSMDALAKEEQIGLVVYNINPLVTQGVSIWDGAKWKSSGIPPLKGYFDTSTWSATKIYFRKTQGVVENLSQLLGELGQNNGVTITATSVKQTPVDDAINKDLFEVTLSVTGTAADNTKDYYVPLYVKDITKQTTTIKFNKN